MTQFNKFNVSVRGDKIHLPMYRPMSKLDARTLAAYLLVLTLDDDKLPAFDSIVDAIIRVHTGELPSEQVESGPENPGTETGNGTGPVDTIAEGVGVLREPGTSDE